MKGFGGVCYTYKAAETETSRINDYWWKEEVFLQATNEAVEKPLK